MISATFSVCALTCAAYQKWPKKQIFSCSFLLHFPFRVGRSLRRDQLVNMHEVVFFLYIFWIVCQGGLNRNRSSRFTRSEHSTMETFDAIEE